MLKEFQLSKHTSQKSKQSTLNLKKKRFQFKNENENWGMNEANDREKIVKEFILSIHL